MLDVIGICLCAWTAIQVARDLYDLGRDSPMVALLVLYGALWWIGGL